MPSRKSPTLITLGDNRVGGEGGYCGGFGLGRPAQAYFIGTQNKAEGPLEQPVMACIRGVDPEPYHNEPHQEIGVR